MPLFLYSGSPVWLLLYWLTVPSSGSWGCVQHLQGSEQAVPGALLEHWCSLPSPLSPWNVLWMGISAGSSHPSAFSIRLALLQTGNKRENARAGGLPEDTVTLRWDWLLPVCLLLAAGLPNPSVSGSALLVCLPAPIQHCREDGYTSQEPSSRSLSPQSWSLAAHTEQCPACATVIRPRHRCPAQEPMCTQSQDWTVRRVCESSYRWL